MGKVDPGTVNGRDFEKGLASNLPTLNVWHSEVAAEGGAGRFPPDATKPTPRP